SLTLIRVLSEAAVSASEITTQFSLSAYYISAALEELSRRSDVSCEELARLEFTYIQTLDHSEHGIPNLERQLAGSPNLFMQALALAFKRNDDGDDPSEWRLANPENARGAARAANTLLTK